MQSSVSRVHSLNDIDVGAFVIVNYNNHFYAAKRSSLDKSVHEIQVKYYEPLFSSMIFYISRSEKTSIGKIIHVRNILLVIHHHSMIGEQNEIYLNHEQFIGIQSICDEL